MAVAVLQQLIVAVGRAGFPCNGAKSLTGVKTFAGSGDDSNQIANEWFTNFCKKQEAMAHPLGSVTNLLEDFKSVRSDLFEGACHWQSC